MHETIWKFTLPQQDEIVLDMPLGARILSVQGQDGEVRLWALVVPEAATERRHFRIFGTGHTVVHAERLVYLGSVQVADGRLVWHVFEQVMFPLAGSLPS